MQVIDPAGWKRKPLCDFFGQLDFPFYGVTFRVDVTRLIERAKTEGISSYYAAVWASMRAVNGLDAFLYKVRGDTIVRHDFLSPSFTVPAEDELFKIVNLSWRPDEPLTEFCARAKRKVEVQTALLPSDADEARDDLVYISCLPWLDFSMLTNETSLNRDDSVPRFTWGKYGGTAGARTMPYSVQVNHRLIDGRAIGAFNAALQRALDAL